MIFTIATTPSEIERDLGTFLALEASGWKAKRGTALAQHEGDAAFVRRAVFDAAARGNCEIVTLHAGETPVASGIVMRHLDRAFYFKMGVDERFAKCSPGVQLTLDLTRHLCADPAIAMADSTAIPGHPMIDPIWRGRLAIADVLIPLGRRDPFVPAIRAGLALRARRALGIDQVEACGRAYIAFAQEFPVYAESLAAFEAHSVEQLATNAASGRCGSPRHEVTARRRRREAGSRLRVFTGPPSRSGS